jgi:hypothetical protein
VRLIYFDEYTAEMTDILRVKDGKTTDHRTVVDQLGLMQLGVVPPAGRNLSIVRDRQLPDGR